MSYDLTDEQIVLVSTELAKIENQWRRLDDVLVDMGQPYALADVWAVRRALFTKHGIFPCAKCGRWLSPIEQYDEWCEDCAVEEGYFG